MNPRYQVSVKGAIWLDEKTLLRGNERGEWELLGGRLEHGEDPVSCVIREFGEESGIAVRVKAIKSPWFYSIGDVRTVLITPFECEATHVPDDLFDQDGGRLRWFAAHELRDLPMPQGYKDTLMGALPRHSRSVISDEQAAAIRARPKMNLPEFAPILEFQFVSPEQKLLLEHLNPGQSPSLPEVVMTPGQPVSELIAHVLRERDLKPSGPLELVSTFTTPSDQIRFVCRQPVNDMPSGKGSSWVDPRQFYEG